MTSEEKFFLNSLLNEDVENFTSYQIIFIVLLSRYMRFAILSRIESMFLQDMGINLIYQFPDNDPGYPNFFNGLSVLPHTNCEFSHIGGPGEERPHCSGDGINFPNFSMEGSKIDLVIIGIS